MDALTVLKGLLDEVDEIRARPLNASRERRLVELQSMIEAIEPLVEQERLVCV